MYSTGIGHCGQVPMLVTVCLTIVSPCGINARRREAQNATPTDLARLSRLCNTNEGGQRNGQYSLSQIIITSEFPNVVVTAPNHAPEAFRICICMRKYDPSTTGCSMVMLWLYTNVHEQHNLLVLLVVKSPASQEKTFEPICAPCPNT
jgi:hypothetical protein